METRYARSGDAYIAYQVVGRGELDLVFLPEWLNHLEQQWDELRQERFLESLASFSRLILLNPRPVGASDPLPIGQSPTAELWMDDLRTVLDAAKSDRPALFGLGTGGTVSILFAATYPQRVRALVLANSCARSGWDVDYPFGIPSEMRDQLLQTMAERWGQGVMLPMWAPHEASDRHLRTWFGRFERSSASPGTALAVNRVLFGLDVRHALPAIQAPTLVLHRAGNRMITVEHGRYLAEHIRGAVYRELPGDGHVHWAGDPRPMLEEVEEFLTGTRSVAAPDRVLATILFTDIVGSTERAAQIGDRRWKETLREHEGIVRRELRRHMGREVNTAGDGFLATFDGPARAIRCALAIRDAVKETGLEIRAGLHTGEVELHGDDVAGIAVHIGARVAAVAEPSEIVVSRTVVDLVAGSGLEFQDRGTHVLKGVPGEWQLFSVAA